MVAGRFYFSWTGGTLGTDGFDGAGTGQPIVTTGSTHGSIATTFAATGDLPGGTVLANISSINGLQTGEIYGVADSAGLIPPGTTFVYEGGDSVVLSQATGAGNDVTLTITAPQLVGETTGATNAGSTSLALDVASGLVVGQTYVAQGPGIPAGDTFVYGGGNAVTLQYPAQLSASGVGITISGLVQSNPFLIDNLADTAGLVIGGQYLVAGAGIPAGASFVYEGGTSVTLDRAATGSALATPLVIVGPLVADAPFATANLLNEEHIFSVAIEHNEGDCATLRIEVRNPRIGLLAAGRNIWAWLAWDAGDGQGPVPIFNGRLVGVPKNLVGEVVQLEFVARPNDYQAQKLAIAQTLQQLPYVDPVFVFDKLNDPDTILETQPLLWHTDRVSLAVSLSNINVGEDGTLVFGEGDHFYDRLEATYGQAPLTSIDVSGTVSWTQGGDGFIDITDELVAAFASPESANATFNASETSQQGQQSQGTISGIGLTSQAIGGTYKVMFIPAQGTSLSGLFGSGTTIDYQVIDPRGQILGLGQVGAQFSIGGISFTISGGPFHPGDSYTIEVATVGAGAGIGASGLIRTMTGEGLKSSWPRPGQSIGSGWSVSGGSACDDVNGILPPFFHLPLTGGALFGNAVLGKSYVPTAFQQAPLGTSSAQAWAAFGNFQAVASMPVSLLAVAMGLKYEAARPRTETVRCALVADLQPMMTDPGNALGEAISLQGRADEAVDPGGALPIGDLRRNSYFQTARGDQSFQFLLLMAVAKLLARARCVKITFGTTLANAVALSCRMNVELHDRRLPGGVATGKIESYALTADGKGGQRATVTIGCTIGNGNAAAAAAAGTAGYVDSGYVDAGYQAVSGAETQVAGAVNYETLTDFAIEDDGVDLFNVTPQAVIQSLIVTNGFEQQVPQLMQATLNPIAAIQQIATEVDLELVPMTGSFATQFNPALSLLSVPRTIDLAAPALGQ